jgi:hypothetical protein
VTASVAGNSMSPYLPAEARRATAIAPKTRLPWFAV